MPQACFVAIRSHPSKTILFGVVICFFYFESQYQKKEYENLMIRMKYLFSNKDITGGTIFGGCDDPRVYGVC